MLRYKNTNLQRFIGKEGLGQNLCYTREGGGHNIYIIMCEVGESRVGVRGC